LASLKTFGTPPASRGGHRHTHRHTHRQRVPLGLKGWTGKGIKIKQK